MQNKSDTARRATTTIPKAAKRLGIGVNQAYAAAKRGDLPVIKIGDRLLVVTAKLDAMLGDGEVA